MASGDAGTVISSGDAIEDRPLSPVLTSARSNRPFAYHRKYSNRRKSRVSLLEKFQSKSDSSILQSKLELEAKAKSQNEAQSQTKLDWNTNPELDTKPKLSTKVSEALSTTEDLQTTKAVQVSEECQKDTKLRKTLEEETNTLSKSFAPIKTEYEQANKSSEKPPSAADRIKRIKQMQNQSKKYYEILANPVGCEKAVKDASAINKKDDFEFKKPISPVSDLKLKKFRGTGHLSNIGLDKLRSNSSPSSLNKPEYDPLKCDDISDTQMICAVDSLENLEEEIAETNKSSIAKVNQSICKILDEEMPETLKKEIGETLDREVEETFSRNMIHRDYNKSCQDEYGQIDISDSQLSRAADDAFCNIEENLCNKSEQLNLVQSKRDQREEFMLSTQETNLYFADFSTSILQNPVEMNTIHKHLPTITEMQSENSTDESVFTTVIVERLGEFENVTKVLENKTDDMKTTGELKNQTIGLEGLILEDHTDAFENPNAALEDPTGNFEEEMYVQLEDLNQIDESVTTYESDVTHKLEPAYKSGPPSTSSYESETIDSSAKQPDDLENSFIGYKQGEYLDSIRHANTLKKNIKVIESKMKDGSLQIKNCGDLTACCPNCKLSYPKKVEIDDREGSGMHRQDCGECTAHRRSGQGRYPENSSVKENDVDVYRSSQEYKTKDYNSKKNYSKEYKLRDHINSSNSKRKRNHDGNQQMLISYEPNFTESPDGQKRICKKVKVERMDDKSPVKCTQNENKIEIALNSSISINITCSTDQQMNIVKGSSCRSPKSSNLSADTENALVQCSRLSNSYQYDEAILKTFNYDGNSMGGFKSASGKDIKISAMSMKKARKIYSEVSSEVNSPKSKGDYVEVERHSPKKERHRKSTDKSVNTEINMSGEINVGKEINRRKEINMRKEVNIRKEMNISKEINTNKDTHNHKYINSEKHKNIDTHTNQGKYEGKLVHSKVNPESGDSPVYLKFKTTTGKTVLISDKALNKAKHIYEEVEKYEQRVQIDDEQQVEPATPTDNSRSPIKENTTSSGSAGKIIEMSGRALDKARNMFSDIKECLDNFISETVTKKSSGTLEEMEKTVESKCGERKILQSSPTKVSEYYGGHNYEKTTTKKLEMSPMENPCRSPLKNLERSPLKNLEISTRMNMEIAPKMNFEMSSRRTAELSPRKISELPPTEISELSPRKKLDIYSRKTLEKSPTKKLEIAPTTLSEISPKKKLDFSQKRKLQMSPTQISEIPPSKRSHAPFSSCRPQPTFQGFTTGTGREIKISEKALRKAKTIFTEIENSENSRINRIDEFLHSSDELKPLDPEVQSLIPKLQSKMSEFQTIFPRIHSKITEVKPEVATSIPSRDIVIPPKKSSIPDEILDTAMEYYEQIKDYHKRDEEMKNDIVLEDAVHFFSEVTGQTQINSFEKQKDFTINLGMGLEKKFETNMICDRVEFQPNMGFKTATGKSIKVKRESLKKANEMYQKTLSDKIETMEEKLKALDATYKTTIGREDATPRESLMKGEGTSKIDYLSVASCEEDGLNIDYKSNDKKSEESTSRSSSSQSIVPYKPMSPRASSLRRRSPRASTSRAISPRAISPRAISPKTISTKAISPRATSPRDSSSRGTSSRGTSSRGTSSRATLPRATSPRATSPRATSPRATPSKAASHREPDSSVPSHYTPSHSASRNIPGTIKLNSNSTKKKLGVSGWKPIVIAQDKLARAKLLFDDPVESWENSAFKVNFNASTPIKGQQNIYNSTPVRNSHLKTVPEQSPSISALANSTLTPIKHIPGSASTVGKLNMSPGNYNLNLGRSRSNILTTAPDLKPYQKNGNLVFETNTKGNLIKESSVKDDFIKERNKEEKCEELGDSHVVIKEVKSMDLKEMQADLYKEYQKMKRKMEIVFAKCEAVELQMKILENKCEEAKRQRPGWLFQKKQNENRLSLRDLECDSQPTLCLYRKYHAITPQVAKNVQFNFNRLNHEATTNIETIDGANIVISMSNLIGLSEIENAFRAMPGVDPNLIPNGWMSNHYKWIVWKLASYDNKFGEFYEDCLTVENVISQLKYRYDREIDRAERPALRKILEKDDVPQKRLVLCVSNIFSEGGKYELELTDGWYALKTTIDQPLTCQVQKSRIRIGMKLMVQCAELLNCEGCYPLEVPDFVRLKINFNNTRKSPWDNKLGYQKLPRPFVIPVRSVHPNGGMIGCLKLTIARVYPLQYLEQNGESRVWRNKKAEETRIQEFELEQQKLIEKVQFTIQKDYENSPKPKKTSEYLNIKDISKISCAETLHEIFENSKDPESLMDQLSITQKANLSHFQQNISMERQSEISQKVTAEMNKLNLGKSTITPVQKLLVLDEKCDSSRPTILSIWRVTEDHLQMFKEGNTFLVFNVLPRLNGELSSNSRTYFQSASVQKKGHSFTRQVLPIAMLTETFTAPMFNEFDTIGMVVQMNINEFDQDLWLTDFVGRLLFIKIWQSPRKCSLLDGLSRGNVVALSNLIFKKSKEDFGQAFGNNHTVISLYPQPKHLHEGLELFKGQLPSDNSSLLADCDVNIEKFLICIDLRKTLKADCNFSSFVTSTIINGSEISDFHNTTDSTDRAMSLIDSQKF